MWEAALPRVPPHRLSFLLLAGDLVAEEHAHVVRRHRRDRRTDFATHDHRVTGDRGLYDGVPLRQLLVVARQIGMPVVAARREHDTLASADEEVLPVALRTHAD